MENEQGSRLDLVRRRQVLQGLALAAGGMAVGCNVLPFRSEPPRLARIGLFRGSQATNAHYDEALFDALRELGYVEGQQFTLVRAADPTESMVERARKLVEHGVDIIVTVGPDQPLAARQVTTEIPVVMIAFSGDAVASGLAASLARPGGNVTGLTSFLEQLGQKRVELLKESVPGLQRLALLQEATFPPAARELADLQAATRFLGLQLQAYSVRDAAEFDGAFSAMRRDQADALFLGGGNLFMTNHARVVELSAAHALPAIYWTIDFVQAGGLMCYAPNIYTIYRRAAWYVVQVLQGRKPADLPIEQPSRFDFAINPKTARALGITFPEHVLIQVTEVVE